MTQRPFYITYWKGFILLIQLISLALVFSALFLNPIIVGKLLHKEGSFSLTTIRFIYGLELFLLLAGIAVFLLQKYCLVKCSEAVKKMTAKIILLICSIVLILFLSEGVVRFFAPQKTLNQLSSMSPPIYEAGDHISWQYKPDSIGRRVIGEFNISYIINSFGNRDKERTFMKKPNTTRILVVGDSITAGFGVEQNETFTYLLERMLNNGSRNFEVWNAGVEGYSQDTEYVYLVNNIKNISPDMVVVVFYAGNDILDISKNSWETDNNGLPINITSDIMYIQDNQLRLKESPLNPYQVDFLGYIEMALFRWSHLYILFKNTFSIKTSHGDFESISLMIEETPKEVAENFEKTKKLLNAMRDLSSENNSSFVVVIFPSRMQINDAEWHIIEKKYAEYRPKRDLVQQRLLEWCSAEQVLCIDLYPPFLSSKKQLYYTLIDIHPNTEGHLMAALILNDRLPLNK